VRRARLDFVCFRKTGAREMKPLRSVPSGTCRAKRRLVCAMSTATILDLLVEKWEAQLDALQRIDETITPPREAMDVHDDADVATLTRLPKAALGRVSLVSGKSLLGVY